MKIGGHPLLQYSQQIWKIKIMVPIDKAWWWNLSNEMRCTHTHFCEMAFTKRMHCEANISEIQTFNKKKICIKVFLGSSSLNKYLKMLLTPVCILGGLNTKWTYDAYVRERNMLFMGFPFFYDESLWWNTKCLDEFGFDPADKYKSIFITSWNKNTRSQLFIKLQLSKKKKTYKYCTVNIYFCFAHVFRMPYKPLFDWKNHLARTWSNYLHKAL